VFSEAFYNETVEVGENMDNAAAEQFFMFLTLVVVGGLVFLYCASKVTPGKKKSTAVTVETGTTTYADASWIGKEHIKKESPSTSPNARARRRKAD